MRPIHPKNTQVSVQYSYGFVSNVILELSDRFKPAFVIGILRNGLNLIGVNPFAQKIFIGFVIVGSVFLDRIRNREKI